MVIFTLRLNYHLYRCLHFITFQKLLFNEDIIILQEYFSFYIKLQSPLQDMIEKFDFTFVIFKKLYVLHKINGFNQI